MMDENSRERNEWRSCTLKRISSREGKLESTRGGMIFLRTDLMNSFYLRVWLIYRLLLISLWKKCKVWKKKIKNNMNNFPKFEVILILPPKQDNLCKYTSKH